MAKKNVYDLAMMAMVMKLCEEIGMVKGNKASNISVIMRPSVTL